MPVMDIQQKVRLQIGDLFVQIMDLSTQLELANEEVARLKAQYEPEPKSEEERKPNGSQLPKDAGPAPKDKSVSNHR